MVRSGEVSAVDVVAAHLRHIAEWDDQIHAFVWVAAEAALDEARAVDEAIRRGEDVGPLAGVPFSVKDVIAVAGMPLRAGSAAVNYVPQRDAPTVARLRAAGAICIGKTNTPEFALYPLTWNETHGYTVNPLHLDAQRSPGGSSGGEAAAIAAGMSAFGLGSDFGGSVRWPAHCTGIVSLRPSVGRVDGTGQFPGAEADGLRSLDPRSVQGQLQVIGPMARTVDDLDLVMSVIAVPSQASDTATRWTQPTPWQSGSADPRTVCVGWCEGEGTVPVLREIVDAVRVAAEDLVPRPRRMRPRALELAADLFTELRATDQQHDIREWGEARDFGQPVRKLLAHTRSVNETDITQLWRRATELRDEMLHEMPDVLLLPVASIGAPHLEDRVFEIDSRRLDPWQVLSASRAVTLFGLPAAVVPIGALPDGSPIGVQVVTRPGRDELAVAVTKLLESRRSAKPVIPTPLRELAAREGKAT
jgi:amidase